MSERKIVDYVFASGDSDYMGDEEDGLVYSVQEFIKDGYQPFGPISQQLDKGTTVYYVQPMVKYEEESQPRVKYAQTLAECEQEEKEREKKHHTNTVTPIERNQYDEESRN